MCNEQELLVGYLYDDIEAVERQVFEAHLRQCAECRAELEGLRATRTHLATWAPPLPDLGFRLIRGGAAPAPALPRRVRLAPAFAFAAAAVIVLAVAAAIANIEVRYGNDGLVLRTGWAGEATTTPSAAQTTAGAAAPAGASAQAEFAALERRLHELERALADRGDAGVQVASGDRMSDAEMLARVRTIVRDAESRQEAAVARTLMQVVRDFDRQRQADFAMIRQGMGEYQGLTNAEIANQMNRLLRVAAGQER